VTYNLLNLPATSVKNVGTDNEITTEWSYLADGTKMAAYVSLYVDVADDADGPQLESVASVGGRFVMAIDPYSASFTAQQRYFITDHLGSTRIVLDKVGSVLERYDYYPYGEKIPVTVANTGNTDYLYTGKESQNALFGINWYDSGARFQTTDGIFTSLDPLAEKYYHLSPYAYCKGNPVNVIDPTGLEFTPESADDLADLESEIVLRLFKNNRRISKLEKKNSDKGESKSRNRRIARMQAENSALEETKYELQVLAASDQVYNITHSEAFSSNEMWIGGAAIDETTGTFNIVVPGNNLGLLAHELKHAYQFESGFLSSGHRTDGIPFYDIHDEIEAYQRGRLFGGDAYDNTNNFYSKLQKGPQSVHSLPTIVLNSPVELQKISNRTHSYFRYKGMTYSPQVKLNIR